MKWGIMGGTFDPIHLGHLRCAEEIRELLSLDKVLFIPASRPPHKDGESVTGFFHRERMIRLAIEGNPFFALSDMENKRQGPSYSVDTVESLLALHPGELDLYFIIGQDVFQTIQTWKDWKRFFLLSHVVITARPGFAEENLADVLPADFAAQFAYDAHLKGYRGPTGRVMFFREISLLEISSSEIREKIEQGKSVRYLLPETVHSYIYEQGCYAPQPSP